MQENHRVLIANITWNPHSWREYYVNPKAGHEYARNSPGHESLNFFFDKIGVDTDQDIYGFVQWTSTPKNLDKDAIIIFYSNNLDAGKGEIVGIYGDVAVLKNDDRIEKDGFKFKDGKFLGNVKAKKGLTMLFPLALDAKKYAQGKRLVPQVGFSYRGIDFAEEIILDEISVLKRNGILVDEYRKLIKIYEFITGREYIEVELNQDEKEQQEIIKEFESKPREELVKYLKSIDNPRQEMIEVTSRHYKRDNKIIAAIKKIRGLRCQICATAILKKDGSFYIEAAHITPKHEEGPEIPENILLLCPNHHKEFDFGDRKIIERSNTSVIFELNNKRYNISLEVK